jgi:hypothetical protein
MGLPGGKENLSFWMTAITKTEAAAWIVNADITIRNG